MESGHTVRVICAELLAERDPLSFWETLYETQCLCMTSELMIITAIRYR